MNVLQRMKAPTPKFFKKLRAVGLTVAGIGTAILTAPVSVPAGLVSLASYLVVAGGVISAVSQATVDNQPEEPVEDDE